MSTNVIKRNTQTQKMWDYIRRNPVFRAGDIAMVLDVKRNSISDYLSVLTNARFIRKEARKVKGMNIEDNEYLLIRNTGVLAPRIYSKRGAVHDPNTGEYHSFRLDSKRKIIFANSLLDRVLKKHKVQKLKYELGALKEILQEIADIAKKIDDVELNILMMRLGLYDEANPESDKYDEEYVRNYIDKQ
ncbi:MAG: hypothetical protein ACK5LP_07210 [Campylobacteraceae bacterium]